MLIVPDNDVLTVEAKVSPTDIAQLHLNQLAQLRFTAFNSTATPELNGHITRVAPDTTEDQHNGTSYYVVRVGIDTGEIEKLKGLQFVPGMPVEVFVQTQPRSMLSTCLSHSETKLCVLCEKARKTRRWIAETLGQGLFNVGASLGTLPAQRLKGPLAPRGETNNFCETNPIALNEDVSVRCG